MKGQRGSALLLILLLLGVVGAFFAVRGLGGLQIERDRQTSDAMGRAKDALVGSAARYNPNVNEALLSGFLPCPDANNDGTAEPNCGANNVSVLGRLPWSTNSMSLPDLRDSAGECFWYAVSGSIKDNPNPANQPNPSQLFNWDTPGQFVVQDAAGAVLAGATPHDRPWAVILSAQAPLGGQNRAAAGASICGGNNAANAYLEGANVLPGANAISTLTLSTRASRDAGLNNDQGAWITSRDVFEAIKRRSDFPASVNGLLGSAAANLSGPAPAQPVTWDFTNPVNLTSTPSLLSAGSLTLGRVPLVALKTNDLLRWRDNLLYARCTSGAACITLQDTSVAPPTSKSCIGVVIFAGERTTAPLQTRATNADMNTWSNYLEGAVLAAFTAGATNFSGPSAYSPAAPSSTDLLSCVSSTSPTQVSFAADFGGFVTTGVGVTPNPATSSVTLANGGGAGGGCFWSPSAVPVAGKTVRAYYEFTFTDADTYALTGAGVDHGYGFTLSFVSGGVPAIPATVPPTYVPPNTCGTQSKMGALDATDAWGVNSFFVETDVYRTLAHNDPAENHTAIMLNGNIDHTGPGDTMSTACNGSAAGCQHAPANKFEEIPPLQHNQRVEIHTGCDATCGTCNPSAHAAPNTYARIATWSSCAACSDVTTNLNRVLQPPTAQRCVDLGTGMYPGGELDSVFFGFTGGFRSGASNQGVTLKNLFLRSE